jgi:hypothetical protein
MPYICLSKPLSALLSLSPLVSRTSLVFALARTLALLVLTVSLDFARKLAFSSCPSDWLTNWPESLGLVVFRSPYLMASNLACHHPFLLHLKARDNLIETKVR